MPNLHPNFCTCTPKPELMGDVINVICHQHYEKRIRQQKSDPNVTVHAAEDNL